MKNISAKKILERLEPDQERGAVSLYLSQPLYKRFKKACGKVSPSKVMEELMKGFVESIDNE